MAEWQPGSWRSGRQVKTTSRKKGDAGKPEMDAIAESDITAGADSETDRPRLSEDTRTRIGQNLRALYNLVVEQPVPESLLKLLRDLGEKERASKKGKDRG